MSSMSDHAPPAPAPNAIAAELRRGAAVSDAAFDQVYPGDVRDISGSCWTPLAVVEQVVGLIAPTAETRVLDVGSGVGKFCIGASLLGPGSYTGVERRADRHEIAVRAQQQLGAERAVLVQGDALDLDWSVYDVLYFYNPFLELVSRLAGSPVDGLEYGPTLQVSMLRSRRDCHRMQVRNRRR